MKTRKKKKRVILKLIVYIILFGLMYAIGVSSFEAFKKKSKLDEFKSRAYETETKTIYEDTYHYHKVKRVHDYELNDQRNVFYNENKLSPGQAGDVLLAFESPFPYIPVAHQFVTFFFGGHAALVAENNTVIESTGMSSDGISKMIGAVLHRGYDEEDEFGLSVQKVSNYWMQSYRSETSPEYAHFGKYYRNEFYAVRTKFENTENINNDINQAINYASDKIDKGLYNYLFFLDTKYKFYCTDLITRAYYSVNDSNGTSYDLNQDGFISSDYDILLSNDTYITIYREKIDNEIHIYYLEDII